MFSWMYAKHFQVALLLSASLPPKSIGYKIRIVVVFVSSASVLDTDFYTGTEAWQCSFSRSVSEDDDLPGSAKGLAPGHGQTKLVCERLMRDAGARGLKGWILRPRYVTEESCRGTTITDDFLARILKGCM
jgi:L-aminoadipate-semialdehyde dehydrogenase